MTGLDADIFQRFSRDVYGWAYRLLGRHHDALDIVQEVFLRWSRQVGHERPRAPRGWLRRVTLNLAIDRRRQAQAESIVAEASPASTREAADRLSERAALRGDIAAALDELTDVQRAVLVAKVYDEATFAEIASEMEFSASTAKTHYMRAIRAVRDRLGSRWNSEDMS